MTSTTQYDAIVLGAGQAGGPLSTALARAGWKTVLIPTIVGAFSIVRDRSPRLLPICTFLLPGSLRQPA